jgi:hypothetical protein
LTHNLYFDTSGNYQVFNTGSANEGSIIQLIDGSIRFRTSAATTGTPSVGERVRIDANGLKFNGDTAAANAFNDYEEGTWTPVIKSGTNTISYSGGNQHFKYTKIGDQVTVYFSLNGVTTSGTTGGTCQIEGLPYAHAADVTQERTMGGIFMFYSSGFRLAEFPVWGHINSPRTKVEFYNKPSAAAAYAGTNVSQVGSSSYAFFQLTYRTAS